MFTVERTTKATPDEVWDVLANGWLFTAWVVGASRMRAVEPQWPAVGAKVHHSVGGWPAVLDDETQVAVSEPGERLVLEARIRPLGQARVELTLTPTGQGTRVRMREDFFRGPGRLVPGPVRQSAMWIRNREALNRLVYLAERRTSPGPNPSPTPRPTPSADHRESLRS